MKYIAKCAEKKLIVSSDELTVSKSRELIEKLNSAGFNLGSGHEIVELVSEGNCYVLKCMPYSGHLGQRVLFELFSN